VDIGGRLPELVMFSGRASNLLPLPIDVEMVRGEIVLSPSLPTGIWSGRANQVNAKARFTLNQQHGIDISLVNQMIFWQKSFFL